MGLFKARCVIISHQKRSPEFVGLLFVGTIHELAVGKDRQTIVDHDVYPFAVEPKSKMKYSYQQKYLVMFFEDNL